MMRLYMNIIWFFIYVSCYFATSLKEPERYDSAWEFRLPLHALKFSCLLVMAGYSQDANYYCNLKVNCGFPHSTFQVLEELHAQHEYHTFPCISVLCLPVVYNRVDKVLETISEAKN